VSDTSSPPIEWTRPCTVADQLAVEALPVELRGAVERYVRSRPMLEGELKSEEYIRGWKAGAEAMHDEIGMIPIPRPPRSR
jgi:hypothetical protein